MVNKITLFNKMDVEVDDIHDNITIKYRDKEFKITVETDTNMLIVSKSEYSEGHSNRVSVSPHNERSIQVY